MRNALRTSSLPFFAAPLVIAGAAGLCIVACSSSSPRAGFDDTADAGGGDGAPSGPGFEQTKDAGPPPSCATAEATAVKPPVDFIFSVAQCGSMGFAVSGVQQNINNLSSLLQKSGLDYRVVLMAAKTGSNALCVPPPLAAAGCASNGNVFRLVDQHIESTDTLALLISTFKTSGGPTAWRDFLRPDALKVFVMVSDEDSSDMPATVFDQQLLQLGGTLFGDQTKRNYIAYPIIGSNAYPAETQCAGASQQGIQYRELAKMTGGKWFPVCSADFNAVLGEIGKTVNASVACELGIPTVDGQELDPDHVNVKVKSPDGKTTDVLKDDSAGCDSGANGWQYSQDGTKIVLCGQACDDVKASPDSKVTVEFGCQTKVK